MKVLIVSTFYHPVQFGGVERVLRTLAESLVALGHSVAVACTSPDGRAGEQTLNGVRVHHVPLRNVYQLLPVDGRPLLLKPLWHAIDTWNVAMMPALRALLDADRPDIIHTHNLGGFSPLVWRAADRRGVPVVHTLHDYYLVCARATLFHSGHNREIPHLPCSLLSGPRRHLSAHVTAVTGVSQSVLGRHLVAGFFGQARLKVIVGNPVVRPSPAIPSPRPDGPLRVGYLGRIEKSKGVEWLLDALASLPAQSSTLALGGLGRAEYVDDITRRLPPNARLVGFVDPGSFLHEIDVLAQPSLSHETFGMAVAEAFAMGIPAIVSNRGGLPELVDDGRTGFVVDPDRPDSLAEVVHELASRPDRLAEMRDDCFAAAAAFDPREIALRYVDVYTASLT